MPLQETNITVIVACSEDNMTAGGIRNKLLKGTYVGFFQLAFVDNRYATVWKCAANLLSSHPHDPCHYRLKQNRMRHGPARTPSQNLSATLETSKVLP